MKTSFPIPEAPIQEHSPCLVLYTRSIMGPSPYLAAAIKHFGSSIVSGLRYTYNIFNLLSSDQVTLFKNNLHDF